MNAEELPIENPCSEQLGPVDRLAAVRYCQRCKHHVQDLSQMTLEEARAFLARTDDACITYRYDAQGVILFRKSARRALLPGTRRTEARHLLTVAAAVPVMAIAACNHSDADPPDRDVAVASAAAASGAVECDSTAVDRRQADIEATKAALRNAEDEATRDRLARELAEQQRAMEVLAGHAPTHSVAGKMARRKADTKCNCPPGDPLCQCL